MSNRQFGFKLPKPEAGIVECHIIVEAADEADAVLKMTDYLVELKKQFTPQPLPVGDSNDPKKVFQEFLRRLSRITEPVAYIVTLHVLVEHWLNQILLKFCPNRDLTDYMFFKKLEITCAIGKIPPNLFHNLQKLNKLRNEVAHDLDYDLTKMDLNYLDSLPDFELSQYKPSYAPNAEQNHIFNVLTGVMSVTYFQLQDHCIKELGFTAVNVHQSASN